MQYSTYTIHLLKLFFILKLTTELAGKSVVELYLNSLSDMPDKI